MGAVTARARAEKPAMVDRRSRILDAARRRFADFGFGATTVRQIADEVDILSGSLYHHFATKEDMLGEIVRDAVLRLRDESARIAALMDDPEVRLSQLVRATLLERAAHPEVHAILFNERRFFRRTPDFAYVLKAKRETYNAWELIIRHGVAHGEFRSDIDTFLTISTVIRMLNSGADWLPHDHATPGDAQAVYPPEALADFYIAFILRAIRTPERVVLPVPAG